MKLIVSILFIVLQFTWTFAAEDITSSQFRALADHPLGHRRTGVQPFALMSEVNVLSSVVELDACYFAAPYGCSDGYCWTTCGGRGTGKWCWLAANRGQGDWLKCTTHDQCDQNGAAANSYCGVNCKEGSKACDCSCDH